jgi:hypothetical protein
LGSSSAPQKLKDIKEWTSMLEDNQYKKINKILFCRPEEEDDNDFQLNYDPSGQLGYECFNTGFPIPEVSVTNYLFKHNTTLNFINNKNLSVTFILLQWMSVTFRPTPRMNLNDICSYTTAYVFMRDDEQKHGYVFFIYLAKYKCKFI